MCPRSLTATSARAAGSRLSNPRGMLVERGVAFMHAHREPAGATAALPQRVRTMHDPANQHPGTSDGVRRTADRLGARSHAPSRAGPSPAALVHYKGPVNRKRRTRCLDARTLAALARGTFPADELHHVREHLPRCSKCLGRIAAAVRRRALGGPARLEHEGPRLPPDADSNPGTLLRSLAVAISLLALGSSATCWYLDPVVPGKGLSHETLRNETVPASGVTHGAMTSVE
jgi:hypothetical protein